jgi:SAM-dependent methyltransferase
MRKRTQADSGRREKVKELISIARSAERYAAEFGVKPDIHLDDHIFRFLIENQSFDCIDSAVRYYFQDALKSSRNLKSIIDELQLRPSSGELKQLEFASGYGCVTRHLKKEIPELRSIACDIHDNAIAFLRENLGVEAILSCRDPKDFKEGPFDLVFALSFFSHMPARTWGNWVRALFDTVSKGGALIFTTQGLKSAKWFGNPAIPANGFWFRPDSEQKDLDVADYGQTIVTESFVRAKLRECLGKEPDIFREGFWWEHQDLYVVRK